MNGTFFAFQLPKDHGFFQGVHLDPLPIRGREKSQSIVKLPNNDKGDEAVRKIHLLGAMLGTVLAAGAYADEPQPISVSHLYVPQGYDDNDEIIVMVDGLLPSTCHQLAPAKVQVDYSSRKVSIDTRAHFNAGPCVQVPVPFEQEVDIGSLAAGEWTLETSLQGPEEALLVEKASSMNPDEYLYAPIDRVEMNFDADKAQWNVTLSGDILATCLTLQETKILKQKKVFVVLPVLTQTTDECLPTSSHFTYSVALPAPIAPGRYLVHVRSLNGRGVNQWLDVAP